MVYANCAVKTMPLLIFIALTLVITGAAYLLSEGAEILAEKFGANFAGSIVLGLVTTLPEYLFVIWACLKGQYGMAVGSAIGACSLLMTLGYGSVILLSTTRLSRHPVSFIELSKRTGTDALYLMMTALMAFFLAWEKGSYDVKDGIILNMLFIMYVINLAKNAAKIHKSNKEMNKTVPKARMRKAWLYLAAGTIIVFFLSEHFVDAMIELAHYWGISPITIAIVLGPLASEMPEKMTAYITVLRNGKLAEISVCNFIGSTINHNSLLLGIIPLLAMLKGQSAVGPVLSVPFYFMTGATLFGSLSLARRKLERWQGVVFMALYGALLWVSFSTLKS